MDRGYGLDPRWTYGAAEPRTQWVGPCAVPRWRVEAVHALQGELGAWGRDGMRGVRWVNVQYKRESF